MSRKIILILSASHLCRNPRVLKEATSLGAAGYDVTVMSVSTVPRFEQLDLELMAGRNFRRVTLDCAPSSRGPGGRRFLQRVSTWGARAALRYLRIETAATLGPAGPLLRLARAFPADLTIAHTEIPLWAASALIRDGRRVAVDLEDWYSEDLLEADRRTRPLRLLRKGEAFALQHAAYVSVPSASMADALVAAYGGTRPLVVRNVSLLPPLARTEQSDPPVPPAFVWFSQTIGPGRGLEHFFAAWARTKNPSRVVLIGEARPGHVDDLLRGLSSGHRAQVQVLPLVAPDELTRLLPGYDLGLALEPATPRNKDVTISNKVFQYLAAGLALVATDTAGQREILSAAPATGLLVPREDPAKFASLLDDLLGDAKRLRACQLAARAAAEREYCWERESARLLAAIARILPEPNPAS